MSCLTLASLEAEPTANLLLIRLNISWAFSPQPPYVSTARGMHSHPSSAHFGPFLVYFFLCSRVTHSCARSQNQAWVKRIHNCDITGSRFSNGPRWNQDISWTGLGMGMVHATSLLKLRRKQSPTENFK